MRAERLTMKWVLVESIPPQEEGLLMQRMTGIRSKSSQLRFRFFLVLAPLALSTGLALAQYGPPPGQYDDQHWGQGPEGYAQNYHEQQGHPMMGARQGWAAGVAQGISDRQNGHSNRPTHVDAFRHVPDSPDGYPRDQFKRS